LQIDCYGNLNVTRLGQQSLKLKLPGGGGGCNLSCDVQHLTLWTAAHRAVVDAKGRRRFRLVDHCDFITSVGHRTVDRKTRAEMAYRGQGPDCLLTELGVFDFDSTGHVRLKALYPDVDLQAVKENTDFDFPVRDDLSVTPLPNPDIVEFIRTFDPLKIHQREFKPQEAVRQFPLN